MIMKDKQTNLLMIFTRNPELGRCKTRLAASVGDEIALEIYTFLLRHTAKVAEQVNAVKKVCFSEKIGAGELWDPKVFQMDIQEGSDLGQRMARAFEQGFREGYRRIIIIGSDMFDLSTEDLNAAFKILEDRDFVLGPALDGGYYLLGMTRFKPDLFAGKTWGTNTVLEDTLADLDGETFALLPLRNDIDVLEDIIDNPAFQPFLNDKI